MTHQDGNNRNHGTTTRKPRKKKDRRLSLTEQCKESMIDKVYELVNKLYRPESDIYKVDIGIDLIEQIRLVIFAYGLMDDSCPEVESLYRMVEPDLEEVLGEEYNLEIKFKNLDNEDQEKIRAAFDSIRKENIASDRIKFKKVGRFGSLKMKELEAGSVFSPDI